MRAVLSDHVVIGRAKPVILDGVRLLGFRIEGWREIGLAEAGPHRRRRAKAVREVDELLA
jgi:hypothetical protein